MVERVEEVRDGFERVVAFEGVREGRRVVVVVIVGAWVEVVEVRRL